MRKARKSDLNKHVFYDVESAMLHAEAIINQGCDTALGVVAEQIYKDSNEFTYRETGDLYKSGELLSPFDKGEVVERTPYARRRYYEGGKAGAGNPKAQPRWFEKTVAKHKEDYKKQIVKAINQAKEGG